jgi:hypothetical protein
VASMMPFEGSWFRLSSDATEFNEGSGWSWRVIIGEGAASSNRYGAERTVRWQDLGKGEPIRRESKSSIRRWQGVKPIFLHELLNAGAHEEI